MKAVKLNLGSGDCPIDGYVNLDRKTGQEVYPLDYENNSVDEIRASHILEHFGRNETLEVLRNWVSKLKPAGLLKIAVPDFAKIAEGYKKGNTMTAGYLCGGQCDENDYHKAIFDRISLTRLLEKAGVLDIRHWDSEIKDCASLPVSLNLMGNKSNGDPEIEKILNEFSQKRGNKYSQYGEDGILEAIFEKIGEANRWVLEVGAADGKLFSNSRQFVEKGWNAILIESDKVAYDRLVKNCKEYPRAIPVFAEVGVNCTLDTILEKYNAPKDLDLMIIDIDGQDYHVWNAMMRYAPRVIVVEFDPNAESEYIPKIGSISTPINLDQAGKTAMIRLGASKGYSACLDTLVNVIMLHKSVFEGEKEIEDYEESKVNLDGMKVKPIESRVLPALEPVEIKTVSAKITAILSAPRIGFINNLMLAAKVLVPLNVQVEVGYGVFWGQILSRLIDEQIARGTEWLVALDYDSYYLTEHFLALGKLMGQYPEADAIMPMQVRREGDILLAGIDDAQQANLEYDANTDLIQVDTGHFGLTFFRLSSFARLKKPWFLAVPNENGDWGEGRTDEDMYFWKNFKRSGLKLYLTPRVMIGHMQLMVTWPGALERGSKPYHQYLTDCGEKGIPEWCKVSQEDIPKQIK